MVLKKVKKLFRYAKNALNFGKKTEICIELNEEQLKFLAAGAVAGFIQLMENREREFYKQLNKMKLK